MGQYFNPVIVDPTGRPLAALNPATYGAGPKLSTHTRADCPLMTAVEILLNTRHIAELVERGEVQAIKEAMEQSLAPGSQTFEQDLFRLYKENTITLDEALANADSPTNLSWLINNAQLQAPAPKTLAPLTVAPADQVEPTPGGASFAEFTLKLDD